MSLGVIPFTASLRTRLRIECFLPGNGESGSSLRLNQTETLRLDGGSWGRGAQPWTWKFKVGYVLTVGLVQRAAGRMSSIGLTSVRVLAVFLATMSFARPSSAQESEAPTTLGASEEMEASSDSVSEEALQGARGHFSNGVQLLQEEPPNYQDAYYQFQSALKKSGGSWKVQGNLGFCALKLERDGEALEHYREYLENGGAAIAGDERRDIERELLLIEGNLARVVISSSDGGAQISVQRQNSAVPAQPYGLKGEKALLGLRSGAFTITATSGKRVLTWEPILTPSNELSHHFDFTESAVAQTPPGKEKPAGSAVEPQPRTEEAPSTLRTVGYATLGVGVLALGGGVVTGLMAQSKETKAKEDCVGLVCPSGAESTKNSAENLAATANVLFITGGVLAAAGVSMVIFGGTASGSEANQATLRLSPGVQPGGGAIFASGAF
jgi:hypothetical protein